MSANDIPEWAVKRACELFNTQKTADTAMWHPSDADAPATGLPQFARYIAAHEEAPVDPVEAEAAAIHNGWVDDSYSAKDAIRKALRRGIELAKAGKA